MIRFFTAHPTAANLLMMTQATSIGNWLVLMEVMGVVSPLFSIGDNAMLADLIPNHQRAQATLCYVWRPISAW